MEFSRRPNFNVAQCIEQILQNSGGTNSMYQDHAQYSVNILEQNNWHPYVVTEFDLLHFLEGEIQRPQRNSNGRTTVCFND